MEKLLLGVVLAILGVLAYADARDQTEVFCGGALVGAGAALVGMWISSLL